MIDAPSHTNGAVASCAERTYDLAGPFPARPPVRQAPLASGSAILIASQPHRIRARTRRTRSRSGLEVMAAPGR